MHRRTITVCLALSFVGLASFPGCSSKSGGFEDDDSGSSSSSSSSGSSSGSVDSGSSSGVVDVFERWAFKQQLVFEWRAFQQQLVIQRRALEQQQLVVGQQHLRWRHKGRVPRRRVVHRQRHPLLQHYAL